jgi:hypothetical protein
MAVHREISWPSAGITLAAYLESDVTVGSCPADPAVVRAWG